MFTLELLGVGVPLGLVFAGKLLILMNYYRNEIWEDSLQYLNRLKSRQNMLRTLLVESKLSNGY